MHLKVQATCISSRTKLTYVCVCIYMYFFNCKEKNILLFSLLQYHGTNFTILKLISCKEW